MAASPPISTGAVSPPCEDPVAPSDPKSPQIYPPFPSPPKESDPMAVQSEAFPGAKGVVTSEIASLLAATDNNGKGVKKRKMNGGGPRAVRNRAPPPISTLTAIRGPPLSSAAARQIMWDQYQPWVLGTYGDAAKTKTITTKKYARIVSLLKSMGCGTSGGLSGGSTLPNILGKDNAMSPVGSLDAANSSTPPPPSLGGSTSEAAKFKLWVKSKGFHLGPPPAHEDRGLPHSVDALYIPTGTDKVSAFYSKLANK